MFAATLGEAIGSLLPAAVAVAISPVPIIAVIVMLGTPRARTNGPAFAAAWILGLTAASTVVLLVTRGAGADDPSSGAWTGASLVQLGLGLLLLVLALRQWRSRPADGSAPQMPGWMTGVDHFGAGRSFGAGTLLSAANPKNLILTASVATTIGQAGLSDTANVIAVGVFVAVGSITVVGAVVFSLIGGTRSAGALASMKSFMSAHSAVIMTVLFLLLGAKVLGEGIAGLSA